MKLYTARLTQLTPAAHVDEIALCYDLRQKSRFKATLPTGEVVGVQLPRTGILRGGSYIATEQGDVLRVVAAPEQLSRVVAADSFLLLKAAYHLGNRHVPLMLTPSALYFEPDHVLEDMVNGLGLQIEHVLAAFEPENGAYQHHEHRLQPLKPVTL